MSSPASPGKPGEWLFHQKATTLPSCVGFSGHRPRRRWGMGAGGGRLWFINPLPSNTEPQNQVGLLQEGEGPKRPWRGGWGRPG